MSTLLAVFFNFIAFIIFAFVLWKKLKDDYHNDTIFKFTLAILAGALLGWWIGESWGKNLVFWLVLTGVLSIGYLYAKRLNLKFFEIIDAVALGTFYFLFLLNLGRAIAILPQINYFLMFNATLSILLIFIFTYFTKSYRRFRWYPSGRVGFAGLAALFLYFFGYSVSAVFKHFQDPVVVFQYSPLSLSIEVVNVIISLSIAGILAWVLYARSGRK